MNPQLHPPKLSLFERWAARLLRRQKVRFSPVFYALHYSRLSWALRAEFGCLSLTVTIAALTILPIGIGYGSLLLASIGAALLLVVGINAVFGMLDMLQARVLPYFEVELGDTETWLAGKALLQHSRLLDDSAQRLGVIPLSEFASGDPLISGESHALFDAAEALVTVEALLFAPETSFLGDPVLDDLTKLRDALALAKDRKVRFSLHLREGSTASGHEMDQRKGSYF